MLTAIRHEYQSYEQVLWDFHDKGWTDGLPIVPPTPGLVEDFLAEAGVEPAEILGAVPTREVTVTAEACAINAVMAGCKPEFAPVSMAAARAVLGHMANIHSPSATLTGASQLIVVSGPVRNKIGINCTTGCFGSGTIANATIGRGMRLMIRNVLKAIPGFLDRATISKPARYSFCFGEDEEGSPWVPMHEERGIPKGTSAVTVQSQTDRFAAWDVEMESPESLLKNIVKTARAREILQDDWLGEERNMIIVIGPEHRSFLTAHGWSKQDIREHLFPLLVEPDTDHDFQHHIHKPEGILIVAAGGPGMGESWIFYPHLALSITVPVD